MNQLMFAFATQPTVGQLELFSESVYDNNQAKRLCDAVKLQQVMEKRDYNFKPFYMEINIESEW